MGFLISRYIKCVFFVALSDGDARFFEKVRFYDDLTVDGLVNGETPGHATKVHTGGSEFEVSSETTLIAPSGNVVRFYTPRKLSGSGGGAPPSGNVYDGKTITIHNLGANAVEITEQQYAGVSTTFHSSSVGYQTSLYCKFQVVGNWRMVYIESLDKWLVY